MTPDPDAVSPAAVGLAALAAAQAGRFDELQQRFAPALRTLVTADTLRLAWESEVATRGPVQSVGQVVATPASPGMTVVRVPVAFRDGAVTLAVGVNAEGWLTGLQILPAGPEAVPAWEPPPYADAAAFGEEEVLLGSGPRSVPGTLTLPRRPGRHPGILLLAGSGPADRDATLGKTKAFRDLAWGLATAGIAVLRFDKVTFAHPTEVKGDATFTVADEYLPAARAGLALLRARPEVDGDRLFVLGHSLGGTVAPRVAAAVPGLAGVVILAGGTQFLPLAAVRQVRYLASLNPQTAAGQQAVIDALTKQAERADSPDLDAGTPATELPFGVPAAYWRDLRAHDPVATAAALRLPMLILQGGRDYQVTIDDDLVHWRAGLAGARDVTIAVHDASNHLFMAGGGPSAPAEHEAPVHVEAAVVAQIATWVLQRPLRITP